MASLGSVSNVSKTPDMDAEVAAFVKDLAKWSVGTQALESEPMAFTPRDAMAGTPIRGTKHTTISVTGRRDDTDTKQERGGVPTLADLNAAESSLDGAMGSVFAEAARNDTSKDLDLSVQGASKKDVDKMLRAMADAPVKEKQWTAAREKEKGNELFKGSCFVYHADALAIYHTRPFRRGVLRPEGRIPSFHYPDCFRNTMEYSLPFPIPEYQSRIYTRSDRLTLSFFIVSAREFRSAIEAYDVSIALDPTVAAPFANRAAAFMKLKRWGDAICDCDAALAICTNHFKALLRRGASRLEANETDAARLSLRDLEIASQVEQGKGEFRDQELVRLTARARKALADDAETKNRAAMKRVAIEESDEDEMVTANATSSKVSAPEAPKAPAAAPKPPKPPAAPETAPARRGPMVFEEIEEEVVGTVVVVETEPEPVGRPRENAGKHTARVKIVIQADSEDDDDDVVDPVALKEHDVVDPVALKQHGNKSFANGRFGEAVGHYTRAIDAMTGTSVSPSTDSENSETAAGHKKQLAVLYANRAACFLKLVDFGKAEADADRAVSTDRTYVKGFHRRAMAKSGLNKFQQALEDYEIVVRANPQSELLQKEVNKCMVNAAEVMLGNVGSGGVESDLSGALLGGLRPGSSGSKQVRIEPDSDDDSSDEETAAEVAVKGVPAEEVKVAEIVQVAVDKVREVTSAEREVVSEPVPVKETEFAEAPPAPSPPPIETRRKIAIVEEDSSDEETEESANGEGGVDQVESATQNVVDPIDVDPVTVVDPVTYPVVEPVSFESETPDETSEAERAKTKGNVFFKNGEFLKAEAQYTLALSLAAVPNPGYFANRAAARLKLQNPQAGLDDADAALALDGRHARARHRRAVCLSLLGRHAECVLEYDNVVHANPGHQGVLAERDSAKQAMLDEAKKQTEVANQVPTMTAAPVRASPASKKTATGPKTLKPPTTATELERGCSALFGKPTELLLFLQTVSSTSIPKLVKHSVSSKILGAYANAFAWGSQSEDSKNSVEKQAVGETFAALASLPRFAFNAALLGREDKKNITAVFEYLGDSVSQDTRTAWGA